MKICTIFNPNSGSNRRDPSLHQELKRRASGANPLFVTEGPGHATQLAAEAVRAGFSRVIAVGGDGTMNETAQALVGTEAALGLVPCGSGNGLALHLGLPTARLEALMLGTNPSARILNMDTGIVNGRPFFNVMGLGLDAEISTRFNKLLRRGLSSYVKTTIGTLVGHRSQRYRITDEFGVSLEVKAMILALCNSDQYGNNARIAPGANVEDGRLELVALSPMNPLRLGYAVIRLFNGSIHHCKAVTTLTGSSFVIERESEDDIHTDGETLKAGKRIDVSVRKGSLRILCPARPVNLKK